MLDRIHLTILREVGRLGTLTEASKVLHLSQSALSHSIHKLEDRMGTVLWEKDGRRLRFTDAGKYLRSVADRLLPQLERAEAVLDQFAQGKKGFLRIGIECHPCYRWLTRIVAPFLHLWPDVDLDIRKEFKFGGIGALMNHEVDMLITPDPLRMQSLEFEPVFDYEMVLVVNRSHPLADRDFVLPEDCAAEALLTYPVEDERLDILSLFLGPSGYRPRSHRYVEDTEILLQMVSAGRGVTALPSWMVGESAVESSLATVKLGTAGLFKKLYIGFRKNDRLAEFIGSFIDLAREFHLPACVSPGAD